MSLRVIRVVAIWLVLLGVSPFTAPFSTCDLSVPVGDLSTGHAELWVKPAGDSDKTPVVVSNMESARPLFDVMTDLAATVTAPGRPPVSSRLVLRI